MIPPPTSSPKPIFLCTNNIWSAANPISQQAIPLCQYCARECWSTVEKQKRSIYLCEMFEVVGEMKEMVEIANVVREFGVG